MRQRWLSRFSRHSIRKRQRKRAAIASESSSVVQLSVMRISSVGKRALGRRSHHRLVAFSISPAPTRMSTWRRYSPQLAKRSGVPVRGSSSKTARRYDLSPVFSPCQKGEEVDKAKRWGKKYEA